MKFDFEQDLKLDMHRQFASYDVKLPIRANLHDQLLEFLSVLKKFVRPRPRRVKYNPILWAMLDGHPKKNEVLALQQLFESGKNVNFFQSKRLFQTNFHDHLVYEWNIFHFHLSFEKEKKSHFAKQVKQLLFVHISDEEVIFLGTDNHEPGTFGDTKWQEVLYDHFPEVLAPYRDDHIKEVHPAVNGQERQTLWDKGYLLGMTTIRGTVFHNPGIGRATSGHSILVTRQVNEIHRWLWRITEQFTQHYDAVLQYYDVDPAIGKLQLRMGKDTLEIFEKTTGTIVLTYNDILDEHLLERK